MIGVLEIVSGPEKGQTYSLNRGKKLVVGRSHGSSIHLTDTLVSRHQCDIVLKEDDKVDLPDAGTSGGTWVNGIRINQHFLQAGDLIQVGATKIAFQWSQSDKTPTDSWKPPPKGE